MPVVNKATSSSKSPSPPALRGGRVLLPQRFPHSQAHHGERRVEREEEVLVLDLGEALGEVLIVSENNVHE